MYLSLPRGLLTFKGLRSESEVIYFSFKKSNNLEKMGTQKKKKDETS